MTNQHGSIKSHLVVIESTNNTSVSYEGFLASKHLFQDVSSGQLWCIVCDYSKAPTGEIIKTMLIKEPDKKLS